MRHAAHAAVAHQQVRAGAEARGWAMPRARRRARSAHERATVAGATQASTGPPMRSVVWRAIGSSKRTSPSPPSASTIAAVARRSAARSAHGALRRDLLADHPDVAGAERDHDVAVAQLRRERRRPRRRAWPRGARRGGPQARISSTSRAARRRRRSAPRRRRRCRSRPRSVGLVERARELVEQIARARVAVRLERDHDAAVAKAGARAGERGARPRPGGGRSRRPP